MADPVIRGLFEAAVHRAGGMDAAAAVLEARWGMGNKSTISRMCAGHIGVTVDAVVAIEDFNKHYPITRRLADRLTAAATASSTMRELGAQSAAAAGAAHAALIEALADGVVTVSEAAAIAAQMRSLREVIDGIVREAEAVVANGTE